MRSSAFTIAVLASLGLVTAHPHKIALSQGSGSEYAASVVAVGLEKSPNSPPLSTAPLVAGLILIPDEPVHISTRAISSQYNGSEYTTSSLAIDPRDEQCTVDLFERLVFHTDMATFQTRRNDQRPACFNWTSNGCSYSPDHPLNFDFLPSCQRHDFGYENAEMLNIFSCSLRNKISENFKKDMMNECEGKSLLKRWSCRRTAKLYKFGVDKWTERKCS